MIRSITPTTTLLRRTSILDPRPKELSRENPILGAAQLMDCDWRCPPFALPIPGSTIQICKVEGWQKTEEFLMQTLKSRHYNIEISEEFQFGIEEFCYRLWDVPSVLEVEIQKWMPGTCVCLACGSAREAIFLQHYGWKVYAVDLLNSALDQGKILEKMYATDQVLPIEWLQLDLRSESALEKLSSRLKPCELATSFMYYHDGLEQLAFDLLKTDGIFLASAYSKAHQSEFGKPNSLMRAVDHSQWDQNRWKLSETSQDGISTICATKAI